MQAFDAGAKRVMSEGRIGIAAMMACAVLVFAACSRPAPEEALRKALSGVQDSIEQRDAAALRRHLAGDFIGPHGMDRDQARSTASLYMMRHQSVGLSIGTLDVEMQESHATVRFRAALTGGSGRLLPDSGNVYQVETGWRLEGGDWKITSARWTPVL